MNRRHETCLLYIAEIFCQGVINGGPPLTTIDMLDSAIVRFTEAITGGAALASSTTGAIQATARMIVDASLVGRARARLQAGRRIEAASDSGSGEATVLPFAWHRRSTPTTSPPKRAEQRPC